MKKARLAALLLLIALLLAPFTASAQTAPPPRRLISAAPGAVPGNAWSAWPAVSPDGLFVAFVSRADNLVPQDTNASADIFLYRLSNSQLSLVSINSRGQQAAAGSFEPVLSANGRITAFSSFASNLTAPGQPADTNSLPDVFAHDRTTATTRRVSVNSTGEEASGWSDQPAVSADGRFIVFASTAKNLAPTDLDTTPDIFIHDLDNRQTRLVSLLPPGFPQEGAASHPQISADGKIIVFRYQTSTASRVFRYDRLTSLVSLPGDQGALPSGATITAGPHISTDGQWIDWTIRTASGEILMLYNHADKSLQAFPYSPGSPPEKLPVTLLAAPPGRLSLSRSADGQFLAFTEDQNGTLQVFLQDQGEKISQDARVSGWVVDSTGRPLAGVRIQLGTTRSLTTTTDGSFLFDSIKPGHFILTAQKKGYTITPGDRTISAIAGSPGVAGLEFTAVPQAALDEAAKDLGMPYSLARGCPSPFEPCGGPFHGFYSGDCTDLVMDAYTVGLDFNIQLALEADFRANPRHYYRWRNARSAQDMWRYFAYTQQVLPPDTSYQIGDIVFFDWQLDGVVDHVAVISEVNRRGAPRRMLDATGVIDDNPAGLAIELEWKPYHAAHTPGHARWNGLPWGYDTSAEQADAYLLASLDSAKVQIRLLNSHDRAASTAALELPGSQIFSTPIGSVVSLAEPHHLSDWYFIELTSTTAAPFELGIQLIHNGSVAGLQTFTGDLLSGETRLFAIQVKTEGDRLTLHLSP